MARTPSFGSNSYLNFPGRDVAAKTGTTNDFRDAWIVGYTPSISTAAWAGNNDNSPMEKKVAGFIIAPLWNEFMNEALSVLPQENFVPPRDESSELKPILRGFWEGGESYVVDKITGKLATEFTPKETQEERVIRSVHSILYWVDKNNPRESVPKDPNKDPQFVRWETPVRNWALQNGLTDQTNDVIPEESDSLHTSKSLPTISYSGIIDGGEYLSGDVIRVEVSSDGKYSLSNVEFYINGRYVGESNSKPFIFSFVPNDISGVKEKNTMRIIGIDRVFGKDTKEVDFSVSF